MRAGAGRRASWSVWLDTLPPRPSLQAAFEDGLKELRDEANSFAAEARRQAQGAARAGRRARPLDAEHSATLGARAQRAPPGSALALTFVARASALQAAMQAAASEEG